MWNILSREKQGLIQEESDEGDGCDCVIRCTAVTLTWTCLRTASPSPHNWEAGRGEELHIFSVQQWEYVHQGAVIHQQT